MNGNLTVGGGGLTSGISIPLANLPAGQNTFAVTAVDTAGNRVSASVTFTVTAVGPQSVSVVPASGSGASQTFSFAFSDTAGASDLTWAEPSCLVGGAEPPHAQPVDLSKPRALPSSAPHLCGR